LALIKKKERPDYGLTNKIGDRISPIFLNFHEYNDMIKDVKIAINLKKKLFFVFGGPLKI